MMKTSLILLLSLISLSSQAYGGISVSSDGGYSGIVIRIHKNVPEEKCPIIIRNLKSLLRDSSAVLHSVLDGRAYFKSVSVVVPSSWRDGRCQTVIRGPKGDVPYRGGDVRVAEPHPLYGSETFTQQTRGCGERGDFIRLPYSFLTANDTLLSAKVFVRQWIKFRYGVFEEFGFPGDKLYPNYFVTGDGKILPTGTYNDRINGMWLKPDVATGCSPDVDEDCRFYADTTANGHIRCSLNYSPLLPNVSRICSPEEIDEESPLMSPSKHNVLCEGKSAFEVIRENSDFSAWRSSGDLDTTPTITLVREPAEQFVFLLETSASMDNREQWKWINKAAQKFIRYDLPVNSKLAIVTFSESAKVEHRLARVDSNRVRANLADTIPDRYHLSRNDKRCVLCGVKAVVHEVLRDNPGGAHIILLTQGSPDTLSSSDENVIRSYITEYDIRMSTLLLPNGGSYLGFYDSLTGIVEGSSTRVIEADDDIIKFYADVNAGLAEVLRESLIPAMEIPQLVTQQEFVSESTSAGEFSVDSTLGRDTLFGVYVPDEEEHLIKSISFVDAQTGARYGPFLRMSSSFDLVNFKTINFPSGQAPPFNSPHRVGTSWKYEIEWFPSSVNRRNIVVVTSKPRTREENSLILIKSWTSGSNYTVSKPTSLYVSVFIGGSHPVSGARVRVSATVEQPNGTTLTLGELPLYDDGNGDPDLMRGDGVYSRSLANYLSVLGRYKFRIEVDDFRGAARIPASNEDKSSSPSKEEEPGQLSTTHILAAGSTCCGSSYESKDLESAGQFRRSVDGPILHIKALPTQDYFPPSRINDLSIRQLPREDNKYLFFAKWSVLHQDEFADKIAAYKLVYSDNLKQLISPRGSPKLLLGFEAADTSAKFTFKDYDKDYYVGLLPYDRSGNRGKISNLIRIRVESPPTPPTPQNTISGRSGLLSAADGRKPGEFDWIMIGIIAGIIGVLTLLVCTAIGYYFIVTRRRQRRRRSEVTSKTGSTSSVIHGSHSSSDHETDSSSFDSDIKNIMANPLGPSLSIPPTAQQGSQPPQQQSVPIKTPSPDSSERTETTNVTPVYWSASQLLSKLDHHPPSPYPYDPYGYPAGPTSLQIQQQHVVLPAQPSSLVPWSYQQDMQRIPDEFTITVGNLGDPLHRGLPPAPSSNKVPPPVHPKPRNITQV